MADKKKGTPETNANINLDTDPHAYFEQTLKRHGYGFHYSVLSEIHQRFNTLMWGVAADEFPISVGGRSTRIDFVLRHVSFTRKLFMVCECKRVNPAYSDWYFLKKPPFGHDLETINAIFEIVNRINPKEDLIQSRIFDFIFQHNLYHLGMEVKTGEKGDRWGPSRDAIEKASTQVCMGSNGLVNYLQENPRILDNPPVANQSHQYVIVPTIFTTARLLCSDLDLSKADFETGDVNVDGVSFEEKPWIFYQYHQSPELRHAARKPDGQDTLRKSLHQEYVRTICIVNPTGISRFLAHRMWWSA